MKLWIVLFLATLTFALFPQRCLATNNRLVTIPPGSAFTRGQSLGLALNASIHTILEKKKEIYSSDAEREQWNQISAAAQATIAKYAPITYAEMEGMASSTDGLDMQSLLLLSTEYEMLMYTSELSQSPLQKCTAFASNGNIDTTTPLISGQNNDEKPSNWFNGVYDVVIHLTDDTDESNPLSTLVYTHPGYPAYMGMNSEGLSVLWTYIDDNERDYSGGLPTNVLLREVLTKKSLFEAIAYINSVPRSVANNYLLAQPNVGMVNIECSPAHFTSLFLSRGDVCHANNIIFDDAMQAIETDIYSGSTTLQRLALMQSLVSANRDAGIDMSVAQSMLSQYPILNNHTLASMVFSPSNNEMSIRFLGDHQFSSYKL